MTRIIQVETLLDPDHPLFAWVRIRTDDGLVGLGETVGKPGAVVRIIHDVYAQILIGEDPRAIERLWHAMFSVISYHGAAGAELRALSAVDIALWDILGRLANQPVYVLLGGACRDRIPIYNTCGSFGSIRDREKFMTDPGGLARDLLTSGITAMKIWPFDELAARHGGQFVAQAAIEEGVAVIRTIREAVGDAIEIAIEGHCLWNLPVSIQIAREVSPYRPLWLEDLIWPYAIDSIAELRRAGGLPVAASERLFGRFAFRELLEKSAADVVMLDVAWTGGISEAIKIAHLASAYELPVTPHNCGGPVSHVVNAHFSAHIRNLSLLETVRAFYTELFPEIVTTNLIPESGTLPLPSGPGFGVELRPDFVELPRIQREVSRRRRTPPSSASGDPWRTEQF
jgi:galactonate dehydratase